MSTIIEFTPTVGGDGIVHLPKAYTDAEDALIIHLEWTMNDDHALDHAWEIVELMMKLGWRPVEELTEKARLEAEAKETE